MNYFFLIKRTTNVFLPKRRNVLDMPARELAALDKQHLHPEQYHRYEHKHYGQNYYFHWL